MRRLPKFVKLIFATVMTLGMYTGVAYGGDGTPPEITVQPESQSNVYGANVEFSITATGENLKYQWQYKPRIKGGTWTNSTNSGATTNTLKLVANDQNEYLYRCLVSDDTYSGDKAIMSNAASLYVLDDRIFEIKYVSETPTAPIITTQPLSQMLSVGDKATFTVEATGTDLTYQWQYKSSLPNSAWTNLTRNDGTGFDTNTFTTTTLTESQDHYQYRCLVRSKDYYYGDENAKESDSATLLLLSATQIVDVQFDKSKLMIIKNFKAIVVTNSGEVTITWSGDGAEEGTTYKLEVLDNNGEWQLLSDNATSPYEQTGVDETKAYEYRISAVFKDGIQGAYAYTISEAILDGTFIIISHDNIAPTITYIDVISEREYITKKDTIKIRFKAEDANYKYEESNILAEDITVKVGGIVNNDVIKSMTKLNTESGEEYTLELTNITKIGELAIVIPQDKVIDKSGNKNLEAEFAIPITVANDVISDDAPSLTLDENEITITNKQTTSITQIEKITYQYRISGDTEFETIPNGESGDKTPTNILKGALADTYYEIRTIVEDSAGNVKESQIATIKTDKMDNNLITITATPTTLTNCDVKVTITYNSKFIKEYSLDGTTWTHVTSGDKKELTIKENTTIYARYTDGVKVTESKTYEVNNIDKQKPTIEKAYVTPEGKSNSKQIKVEGIVDLGVAGIKGYYINKESNLENATWQSFTGSEFSHKVTENGVYYVWVSDNAGNISEAKLVVVTGIVDGVSNIKYTGVIELEVGETRRLVVTYSGEAMSETYKSKNEKIVKVEANIKQIEGKSVGETEVIGTITDYDGTEHQVVIRVIVTPVTLQVKLTSDGNEYTGEWTNKDVKAELTTNGVKPSGYKEKDGENESLKDPKNIDINNITGKATITYDEDFSGEKYYVGNNSDGNQITNVAGGYLIKLDKTAPTIGVARKVVGTNSIAVQIVGADDALSGIKEYEIMIYKDDTCLATYKGESGEVTFANLKSSTAYQIKYKITDNAGNTTDLIDGGTEITGVIKKMVTYDYLTNGGTKLTLGSTEVVEAGKLFNLETIAGQFVDLTLESQKAGYIFKGWAKTPSGEVLTSLVMPEEDMTLYAIFKDESAPVVTDKAYETVDGKLELILKAEDTGSGIEDYAVTTDEGTPNEWVTKTPEADGKVRLEVPGTNRYYVWVRDKEGNITRYEQIAIKDIFAPTGKVEVKENIVNNLPYAKSNEVKLYIEAEDNESVAQDIKVAIYNETEYKNLKKYSDINFAYTYKDGGLNLTWQTTAGDGLKRIYVILKDKAGNISTTIKQLP